MMKIDNLKLTQEWDKTFPKSEKSGPLQGKLCQSLWDHAGG